MCSWCFLTLGNAFLCRDSGRFLQWFNLDLQGFFYCDFRHVSSPPPPLNYIRHVVFYRKCVLALQFYSVLLHILQSWSHWKVQRLWSLVGWMSPLSNIEISSTGGGIALFRTAKNAKYDQALIVASTSHDDCWGMSFRAPLVDCSKIIQTSCNFR